MAGEKESESSSSSELCTTEHGRTQSKNQRNNGRGRSRSKIKHNILVCKNKGYVKKDCYMGKKKVESEGNGEADSGCTAHMTSIRGCFCEFQGNESFTILLGDDHSLKSEVMGTIRINFHGGSIRVLNNVKYVPKLRRNLISRETLDRFGYKHEGGSGKIRYFKNNNTALRGEQKNGLHVLDGETEIDEAYSVVRSTDATSRLGHISHNNVKTLVNNGFIQKKDIQGIEFYEHCVMGKAKKLSFDIGKHNTGN